MTIELLCKRGLSKKSNVDFSYNERKTFYKNVPNATNFLFDLGMESGMERPQYIIVGFENNNVNEQTHDASTFEIMNVTECYCKTGSECYPEDRMNIIMVLKTIMRLLKRFLALIKIIMVYHII